VYGGSDAVLFYVVLFVLFVASLLVILLLLIEKYDMHILKRRTEVSLT
jgi:hypothetical protein